MARGRGIFEGERLQHRAGGGRGGGGVHTCKTFMFAWRIIVGHCHCCLLSRDECPGAVTRLALKTNSFAEDVLLNHSQNNFVVTHHSAGVNAIGLAHIIIPFRS